MKEFLGAGGKISCTVGLDFSGTTEEGLAILLGLEGVYPKQVQSFVYKNEWSGSTFHPKLYLFTDDSEALLVVGSNNLTGAGLTTNIETSIAVSGKVSDRQIARAASLLAEWRIPGPLIKRLNGKLLGELKGAGYVQTEDERAEWRARERGKRKAVNPLFGTIFIYSALNASKAHEAKPEAASFGEDTGAASGLKGASYGTAKLVVFRVRGHRGSQIQVPKNLRFSPFMAPADSISSTHDSDLHNLLTSHSGGKANYWYFEAPEIRGIAASHPLLKLYWQQDKLWYTVVDPETAEGKQLLRVLDDGRKTSPPETHDTKPGNSNTQSWRIVE